MPDVFNQEPCFVPEKLIKRLKKDLSCNVYSVYQYISVPLSRSAPTVNKVYSLISELHRYWWILLSWDRAMIAISHCLQTCAKLS